MDIDDTNIPFLTAQEVQDLVDVSASFLNLADYPTSAGPANRKAAERLRVRASRAEIKTII
jgi:hypothetical protein